MLQEERQAGEGERGATSRTEKGSPQSKGKIATAVKEVTITKTTAETTAITRITTAEAKKKKKKVETGTRQQQQESKQGSTQEHVQG